MKTSTVLIGIAAWAFMFPAFADLMLPLGPNSPPKDLNRAQGGIAGLDPWTANGTFTHACYVFPRYVVWSEEALNADQGNFQVEPIVSNIEEKSLCQRGPRENDLRFDGHFNGLAGDYGFSYYFGSNAPHENHLQVFNVKTGKKLWETEYDYSKSVEVKEGRLRYWKKEAKVTSKNCPEFNQNDAPPDLLFILNRHTELDLSALKERKMPDARCADPRSRLLG